MITEVMLRELGFVPFVFLRKEERDGLKRFAWIGDIDNVSVIVRLRQEGEDNWYIELISVESIINVESMKKELYHLKAENSIEKLISIIKENGRMW